MVKLLLRIMKTRLMKIRKISEVLYLSMSIIATADYLFGSNNDYRKNILLLFAVIFLCMFFFRRYYRKKFQNRIK
jgi:hypothetical protein